MPDAFGGETAVPTFIDPSGTAVAIDVHDAVAVEEPMTPGRVLAGAPQGGQKPRHYVVVRVEDGDPATVHVKVARPSLWKSVLLAALLGASWYVIQYLVEHIF
ncbi:MAG: hypothetical protein AB7E47_05095 [Desulfovibrionaceae bacterium]